ncbi:LicD family protein [Latilactobacillus curvatus]
MNIKNVHQIELEMLKYFREFCRVNELTFFIDSGTLLGAVRHKGFIPWDDDIDLVMPRKDYEKFKKMAISFECPEYKALFLEEQADYYYPYIKLTDKRTIIKEANQKKIKGLGVFIDIFPIDVLPEKSKERTSYFKKISFLKKITRISAQESSLSKNPFKIFVVKILNKFSTRKLLLKFDSIAASYSGTTSKMCTEAVGSIANIVLPKDIFEKEILLSFENELMPAPIGYAEYLEILYGDYLKLPPENQRINHKLDVKYSEGK